jgi:hypothetical protein
MDAVVAANPAYRWNASQGVVDLIPKAGAAPLLSTMLARFELIPEAGWGPSAVIGKMVSMPAVSQRAAELGFRPGIRSVGPSVVDINPTSKTLPQIHIDLRNLTLFDAFNSVARSYGNTVWVYTEFVCDETRTYTVETWSD